MELPLAALPLVTRVWAKPPWSDLKSNVRDSDAILWDIGQAHPFMRGYRVMRMYVMPGASVEVYSANFNADGSPGPGHPTRHTIPWHEVRVVEEAMDAETFVSEILDAETDDEDDDGPEPAPAPAPPPLVPLPGPANGSPS
jgi:hypothetical protein